MNLDVGPVAEFLAARLERRHGPRWLGGARRPPLASDGDADGARLREFATRRLFRVPDAVPRALLAWAKGERKVGWIERKPSAREMLGLQARGWRCVSLLADDVDTAPHADALDFAIHDLCHLEKLAAPEHHEAQVGFFALLDRAVDDPRWRELEARFDAAWCADRDYVLADMNGHAIYLFVALKRKIWLASARAFPGDEDRARCAHETLFDLLELDGEARAVARAIGAKGSLPAGLASLVAHLTRAGAAVGARDQGAGFGA